MRKPHSSNCADFNPRCSECIKNGGIKAIIKHLETCAEQNEKDARGILCTQDFAAAVAVAAEQRRMISILKILSTRGHGREPSA